ncbi:MAG TPA: tripartite tricarboxylate transporter substrate binding protein [Ideonella sp.]|nr:tripartite tricarboxylate transporter substrate binding protein [Ideonella sp.]
MPSSLHVPTLHRRRLLQLAGAQGAGLLLGTAAVSSARAAAYPAQPVKFIVGNGPGSAADTVARQVAKQLEAQWKQPVVVENRPAASGTVAATLVAQAKPDGLTFLVGQEGALAIAPALKQKLGYDAQKDLQPVVALADADFVLVANPASGFTRLDELLAEARRHPGQRTYASSGIGSTHHLAMELLKSQAKVFMLHIPYNGGPAGMGGVLSNQVDCTYIAIGPALGLIRSGKLNALAVTGPETSPLLPGVLPVAQSLPGYRSGTWYALFAPKGTPADIVAQVNEATNAVLRQPELRASLSAQGIRPAGGSSLDLAHTLQKDTLQYTQLARRLNIELV